MKDWAVLESFTSESEARVVESFLRAQGFEVQLLDTHTNAYAPTSQMLGRGMRLLVREKDLESARAMMIEGQRGSHLEIVGELQPVEKSPYEKWMVILVLIALAIAGAVSYLK
jgi:hypothetical protein